MSQVRYQPLGPLLAGEGSRAFLGLALESGAPARPVVLVWAPPEVARDTELCAQLERETQRASVLEHPNILRVHGMVNLEAGLARVTEFADGESLRRVLEVRPRMPPAFAALIVSDVAMGVHYAHLAGNDDGTPLVHGDLRPETVMVSFSGVCKVTGYGALNLAPRERNGRRVRNRRNYTAPEQLMGGREAVTARTDVFLLGLLLHECLSGRMPFQDAQDADQAVLNRQLPPLPSDIPRPLAEVVRTATAKRANERYETALEFREAVVAAIEGLPTAETFSEFLTQLFPPERDARATRRQMLEIGLADVARRASNSSTGTPTVQPALRPSGSTPAPAPTRPSGSLARPLTPLAEIDESTLDSLEVPFQDEDADTVDSVMELTGRHSLPGVAQPLPVREEPRPAPSLEEEPRTPPLPEKGTPPPAPEEPAAEQPAPTPGRKKPARVAVEEEEEAPPRKRRSRAPLLVGALAAMAAAAGGFVLWTQHQRAQQKLAEEQVAAVTPPAAPTAAPAKAAEPAPAAPDHAGTPPATAQLAPTDAGTAVASASPTDAGTPSAQGAAPAVVLAGGTAPAMPGGAVVPASATVPASPPTAANTAAPEAAQAPITTRLQLFVLPPVEVALDGKRLGKTPLTLPLAPGTYTFELSNPAKGIRKTTRAITIKPQGTTVQRFLVGKGTVLVRAPAGSRIFLNGRKAGPKLSLFEGEHQLVVTTGKARWEKTFQLEARQRVTFDVTHDKP